MSNYYIYVLTNKNHKVMYVGVTNDLMRRIQEHKQKKISGFTKKYNVDQLVYFEHTQDANAAVAREKQLKGWLRIKKNELVETMNPSWRDLSEEWQRDPSLRSG
jgi:putative endonuclease